MLYFHTTILLLLSICIGQRMTVKCDFILLWKQWLQVVSLKNSGEKHTHKYAFLFSLPTLGGCLSVHFGKRCVGVTLKKKRKKFWLLYVNTSYISDKSCMSYHSRRHVLVRCWQQQRTQTHTSTHVP